MPNPETPSAKRQHFSLIRSFALADFLTLGNAFCGGGSILASMKFLVTVNDRWLVLAMWLLPLALVLDFADGRVARWRRKSSSLGADLDSLADIVSFVIAPVALGFAFGLRGSLDIICLLFFIGCGISRLARFNATAAALADESGKVKYFEGTPVTVSLLIVALFAVLFCMDRTIGNLWLGAWVIGGMGLHPLALLYVVAGNFMISTVRVPKI